MVRVVIAVFVALSGCRIDYEPTANRADATVRADGGAVDASIETNVCDRPTAVLCDSFDDGIGTSVVSGEAQWLAGAGPDGTGAMHAIGRPGASGVAIYTWAEPIVAGRLHARARLRVAAGDPVDAYAVLIQLDNGVETMGLEKVSADISTADLLAVAAPFTGRGGESTIAMPREHWVCLELDIDVDANGSLALWLDGEQVYGASAVDTVVPGGFQRLVLGSLVSRSDPPVEVVVDDLIVATEPIGCE